ncbi:ImuA family protein [Pseudotabrizicola sp. L79]|uniref:ImuA family protein n=1 Tax=Pseudotabrizicola sp. L79 TaxID=3118402 RepID=UPI002F93BD71
MILPIPNSQGPRALPPHPLPGQILPGLIRGRIHEICGPARVALALMTLALSDGPVIWVAPSWLPERLYTCGIRDHLHPGRLVLVQCRRAEEIQWAAEEALRSGTAPAVVAEYPSPPGLTAVRRLHLAAETPGQSGHPAPLGLVLTAGDGGAQGVESRWQAHALPSPSGLRDEAGVALGITLLRARQAAPARWRLIRPAKGPTSATPAP